MYLNSSSNSYEKKYLKYKNKYNVLKIQLGGAKGTLRGGAKGTLRGGAKGTLRGGDCDPLPDEEDYDIMTRENLFDLDPYERITIQNRCYYVKSLYRWIVVLNHDLLPGIETAINNNDRQRLIQANETLIQEYERLRDVEDVITRENLFDLDPCERITIQNRCYDIRGLYSWFVELNNDTLPDTLRLISNNDRQRLIQKYGRLL